MKEAVDPTGFLVILLSISNLEKKVISFVSKFIFSVVPGHFLY